MSENSGLVWEGHAFDLMSSDSNFVSNFIKAQDDGISRAAFMQVGESFTSNEDFSFDCINRITKKNVKLTLTKGKVYRVTSLTSPSNMGTIALGKPRVIHIIEVNEGELGFTKTQLKDLLKKQQITITNKTRDIK